jgi:hypothetical protein
MRSVSEAELHRRYRERAQRAMDAMTAERDALRSALRVIRTWAAFDIENPSYDARICPQQVVTVCDKALEIAAPRQGGQREG